MKISIKKIVLRSILQGAIMSLIIMGVLSYVTQSGFSKFTLTETAEVRISDALQRLEESENSVAQLTDELKEEYLIKTRMFSQMVSLNPAILDDTAKLEEIRAQLDVDELHVTDEAGIIQWSTVPGYIGFDFHGSDQTEPFLPILTDSSFELAQDPQPNGSEGKLFQYISVSRYDKPGIVQIGMEPVRLTNALKDNQPDVILGDIKVGQNGTIFAVNKSDMTLAAFKNTALIGSPASDAGLTDKALNLGEGKLKRFKVDGENVYVCVSQTDEYYVGAMIPVSEATAQAFSLTVVIEVMTLLIIAVLAYVVILAINKQVLTKMTILEDNMKKIGDGNTDIRVDIRNCTEFSALSDGINSMLDGIEAQIKETNRLNSSMEGLLEDVYKTSQNINSYSADMQDVSRRISDGSSSQAETVEELSGSFRNIARDVQENADSAEEASRFSREASEQLRVSVENMRQMKKAMAEITDYSGRIEKIIKTIDDIAFQTNILALNAAVEAARAGANGKGFAVVADEVRNLANKSAEAANSTTTLISETIHAVENGNVIANAAAEELENTISGIDRSVSLISEISDASAKQAEAVSEATNGMERISEVARSNSEISRSASDTAERLDEEAEGLIRLISSKSHDNNGLK